MSPFGFVCCSSLADAGVLGLREKEPGGGGGSMFPDHRGRDLTPFAPSSIQHMPDPELWVNPGLRDEGAHTCLLE